MRTFAQPNPRPDKLRLPTALLEHIQRDIRRTARGIIKPGEILQLKVPGTIGAVWIWDLSDAGPISENIMDPSTMPFRISGALASILQYSARYPKGLLFVLPSEGIAIVDDSTVPAIYSLFAEIDDIPHGGEFGKIVVGEKSLPDVVNIIFHIKDWAPQPVFSAGLAALNPHDAFTPVSSLKVAIDEIPLYIHKSAYLQLLSANIPIMFRSTFGHPLLPAMEYLVNIVKFDAVLQEGSFGVKPHTHMLLASHVASGSSEVAVWRNIEDAESTREALQQFKRQLKALKKRKSFSKYTWPAIFEQYVLGKIVEQVPVENAETGEQVMYLQI